MRYSSYLNMRSRENENKVNKRRMDAAKYMEKWYPAAYVVREADNGKTYVKAFYLSRHKNSCKSELKKRASREFRRNNHNICRGNEYKKYLDIWWILY